MSPAPELCSDSASRHGRRLQRQQSQVLQLRWKLQDLLGLQLIWAVADAKAAAPEQRILEMEQNKMWLASDLKLIQALLIPSKLN